VGFDVPHEGLAAGGRVIWPFIAWQLNRAGGSGNVTRMRAKA
jgi:hypothetical protein